MCESSRRTVTGTDLNRSRIFQGGRFGHKDWYMSPNCGPKEIAHTSCPSFLEMDTTDSRSVFRSRSGGWLVHEHTGFQPQT